jgi:copper/silver efflux system protein
VAELLPIMWSYGTGAEVIQRIAVPIIGGMVASTLLTLIVIPAIYAVVKASRSDRRRFRCRPGHLGSPYRHGSVPVKCPARDYPV